MLPPGHGGSPLLWSGRTAKLDPSETSASTTSPVPMPFKPEVIWKVTVAGAKPDGAGGLKPHCEKCETSAPMVPDKRFVPDATGSHPLES